MPWLQRLVLRDMGEEFTFLNGKKGRGIVSPPYLDNGFLVQDTLSARFFQEHNHALAAAPRPAGHGRRVHVFKWEKGKGYCKPPDGFLPSFFVK